MNIRIRNAYEDLDETFQVDVRIIVDVFRASTTAVAILEKQPLEFLIANDLEIVKKLASDSYRVVSEVFDLGINNSPSLVHKKFSIGEKVVQKTTNLTTAIEKNCFDGVTLIGCFNNLSALIGFIDKQGFKKIEIVPAGQMEIQHPMVEDTHCAEMIREHLTSKSQSVPNLQLMLGNFEEKKKTRGWPDFYIEDLEIAVQMNISEVVPIVARKDFGIFTVRNGAT